MQNEQTLLELGFTHFKEWDGFQDAGMGSSEYHSKHFRADINGKIFRAMVNDTVTPNYVSLGIVVKPSGVVDRWRDCCSFDSVKRKLYETR